MWVVAVRGTRLWVAFSALALVTLIGKEATAQAWVQPKGSVYLKTAVSALYTEDEFDFRGERQEIFAEDATRTSTSFHNVAVTEYVEYGIFDNLTLVSKLAFVITATKETLTPLPGATPQRVTRRNTGFGDTALLVRTPLLRRPIAVALQAGVKVPLGYDRRPENDGPPPGTGRVEGGVQVNAGWSFFPPHAYFSVGGGYRRRGGELHDEVMYNVEAGYRAARLFMKVRFDGLQNTKDPPDIAGATIITPFPGGVLNQIIVGDQDIFKLSVETSVAMNERVSLSAEAFHTLAGKDTVTGTTYSLAMVYFH